MNNNQKANQLNSIRRPTRMCASANTQTACESCWISSSELELGMYVSELDKPWESTRFLFQGFVIDSYELLRQVQDACERANVQINKLSCHAPKKAQR